MDNRAQLLQVSGQYHVGMLIREAFDRYHDFRLLPLTRLVYEDASEMATLHAQAGQGPSRGACRYNDPVLENIFQGRHRKYLVVVDEGEFVERLGEVTELSGHRIHTKYVCSTEVHQLLCDEVGSGVIRCACQDSGIGITFEELLNSLDDRNRFSCSWTERDTLIRLCKRHTAIVHLRSEHDEGHTSPWLMYNGRHCL